MMYPMMYYQPMMYNPIGYAGPSMMPGMPPVQEIVGKDGQKVKIIVLDNKDSTPAELKRVQSAHGRIKNQKEAKKGKAGDVDSSNGLIRNDQKGTTKGKDSSFEEEKT